jgi:hypothetical protein
MITVLEQRTHENIQNSLPRIAEALERIAAVLERSEVTVLNSGKTVEVKDV